MPALIGAAVEQPEGSGLDVRLENNVSILRASIGDDMLTATWRDLPTPAVETNYQRFIAAVRAGKQVLPDFARGAALQQVLDLAVESDKQKSIGLAV